MDDLDEENDDVEEVNGDEEDIEEEEEDEPEPEPPKPRSRLAQARMEKSKLESLVRRMKTERMPLRVHDVIIRGNTKTKEAVIEAETAPLKDVSSFQELMDVSQQVNLGLQALDVFDAVRITLDAGPPELPDTANVVVEVVESGNPISGEIGAYTKGEARSSTIEGSVKYKNIFGYGDLWDGSLAYGYDHRGELSAGVYLPRFRGLPTPVTARLSLLSQDWLKFSSFKERSLGISLGLFSSRNHDVVYTLGWRALTDPTQLASRPIRRQLGHDLLSSLKYTFKIDRRNSPVRPTRGFAFVSTTQIGGLAPDSRSVRFLRQENGLQIAVPLGFYRSALNLGVSAGVVLPWGPGFSDMRSPLPERFFLGGNLSPVCTMGGPLALWGFGTRGLGPSEPRRQVQNNQADENADPGRDYIGGDLAVTAFADLSFDFPSQWCRAKGIHGHIFASAGNVDKLTENAYRNFSFRKFGESFRSCAGAGIVIPTSLFRLELNYCYMLKKFDNDQGKSGFRVSFSTIS
ncbi:hypothetical protein Tsubulata_029848 [Turnera subulata]|uniref:Bacterial surface antigen (D15) domain-containing protein n=1 Tax=Turnera subulata TaxID=218843 RepID=A0A9Q0J6Q3_9ROSI|nr:hypothetical protein Tsubulata_029848 [Turnera subulata]